MLISIFRAKAGSLKDNEILTKKPSLCYFIIDKRVFNRAAFFDIITNFVY